MLFHRISPVDVQPGDHLYRWRYFKIIQGIAIEQNDGNTVTIFVVIPNEMNSFRLISLREFQGRGYLRRVLYNQGDSYLHPIKLSGTSFIDEKRPAEEVVRNALLLVNSNINPQFMQQLLTPGTSNFARLCCTMPHEQWRTYLQANGYTPTRGNTPVEASAPPSPLLDGRSESEESEDGPSCPVCFERPCNVAFGCGHLICSQCSPSLHTCHICRRDIRQRIPLFWC